MAGGRFRELLKKYGKVALVVHCSVSAASISGLYVAIKNNIDVESALEKVRFKQFESILEKVGMGGPKEELEAETTVSDREMIGEVAKPRNRTAELAASSGGALALAVLCNKALFPIRVPITIAVTPPIARFLARRQIIKNSECILRCSEIQLSGWEFDSELRFFGGRYGKKVVNLGNNHGKFGEVGSCESRSHMVPKACAKAHALVF